MRIAVLPTTLLRTYSLIFVPSITFTCVKFIENGYNISFHHGYFYIYLVLRFIIGVTAVQDNIAGFENDMIHMFNKNESCIHSSPYFDELRGRRNVLLMGDSLGDIKMTQGLPEPNTILKIGFLNDKVRLHLALSALMSWKYFCINFYPISSWIHL